jgi:membrane-bound metal-dependent hydrolase YbcI (DUF457 family)
MPYPPSHMGVGLLAKAINPEKFSLTMFGLAQIVIDIQPLLNRINPALMARHTPSHSIIGAIVVMLFCMALRKPTGRLFKVSITSMAAFYGAAFGVFSHLLLDGIDHADVSKHLFWPLKIDSHLFYLVSNFQLVLICLLLGIVGIIVLQRRGEINRYMLQLKKASIKA